MRQHVIYLTAIAGTLAALAGCRQDANIQLLRRDLRLHEDQIYHLEDTLAEYEGRLASCHRQNEALKRRLAADGGVVEPRPEPREPRREPPPSRVRPPVQEPLPPANGVSPPKIDLGTETTPEEVQPKVEPKRLPNSPDPEPSAHTNPQREQGVAHTSPKRERGVSYTALAADLPRIRSIAVNPRLSGGNNTDGRHGDEGVMLVLETRDEHNRLVEAPGEMSLIILDPAESGEAAQVAEWDFAADDMGASFRRTRFGQGYIFELPWPGEPPKHEKLLMRIRYTTPDGRTLTQEHPFKAEILGHDEFLTRSLRAPRQKPWSLDRPTRSPMAPPANEESEMPPRVTLDPPLSAADSPRSTLHSPPSPTAPPMASRAINCS